LRNQKQLTNSRRRLTTRANSRDNSIGCCTRWPRLTRRPGPSIRNPLYIEHRDVGRSSDGATRPRAAPRNAPRRKGTLGSPKTTSSI
jgi:hypothetical protein